MNQNTQHTNQIPVAPKTSSFNPFNLIGALASDIVEGVKTMASEASDIPQAIADGYNNGLILDTDNSRALKDAEDNAELQTTVTTTESITEQTTTAA